MLFIGQMPKEHLFRSSTIVQVHKSGVVSAEGTQEQGDADLHRVVEAAWIEAGK